MSKMNVIDINLDDIDADDEFNCRGAIAPIDVAELAQNIKEQGLLQPGVVMHHPHPETGFKYKLIAGFRRRFATKILGIKMFPCVVKEDIDENDAMFFNLHENIQRSDLTILQEAKALAKIKVANPCINRDGCAAKLGKSPGWVQIREMLLKLPEEVQKEVASGVINQTQIRELNTIRKKEGIERVFEAAKEMKRAKVAGTRPKIKKKINREAKRERKRTEIFQMLADINDSIPYQDEKGYCLWPRVMAWCAGEISDNELFVSCMIYCENRGLNWVEPDNLTRTDIPD